MASFARRSRGPSRTALVTVLLLLTLGLAGMMAYQAFDAARSHREVAQQTLREHASFAAWELSSTLRREFFSQFIAPGLELVGKLGGAHGGTRLATPMELRKVGRELAWWPGMQHLDYLFRYDPEGGELVTSGDGGPDPKTEAWLRGLAEARTRPGGMKKEYPLEMVLHWADDEEKIVALAVEPRQDDAGLLVFGFQTSAKALLPVLSKVEQLAPLLPPALTLGVPTAEFLSFGVWSPGGEFYHSEARYQSEYEAIDTLGEAFGDLVVGVSLRAEVAESLIIGGLPRTRLPMILGLLALASGLVLVGIFQLRKEQELALLRTDFVSSVSHQLRTPLAQIRMFGETLLLGRVRSEEERVRSLEIIVKEAQRLSHQVDNVLHFSRAQRGDTRLVPTSTLLAPLIRDVLESFCPLAEAQDCRVEAALDESLWGHVDPVAVRQILLNLLENAVKYGPPDQIVDVRLRKGPRGSVRLMVEDEGEGIPEAEREEIFAPYARLERHRDSGVAGSGIGLAVVRELAERQGGSVWVEEAAGGGARFVVELPLTAAPPNPPPQVTTEAPAGAPTPVERVSASEERRG